MAQAPAQNASVGSEPPSFWLLLATFREPLQSFFENISIGPAPVRVTRFEPTPAALADHHADLAGAKAAVVDVAVDPLVAAELCREIHRLCPTLPTAALVCCPSSIAVRSLRLLFESGVAGVIDLQTTPDATARALESLALGELVLELRVRPAEREVLRDALVAGVPQGEVTLRLLELVASGSTDREIGLQLYLSPHTVKHRVERLRRALGVRNRAELAAWAGRNGFYRSERRRLLNKSPLVPARDRRA